MLEVLAPVLLMIIGGIITWLLKSQLEEFRATKEKLREERRKIYIDILDPYIRLFSDFKGQGGTQALKKLTSYQHRKTAFELNLFGSDGVVRAYNALMQHAFKAESSGDKNPKEMMLLWGQLLLEIRKSLGNKRTELRDLDMLRGMITDIDKFLGA